MTTEEIVKKYLVDNGYEGLVATKLECGCQLSDFASCGEMGMDCEPAILHKCQPPCECGGEWLMELAPPQEPKQEVT